MLGRPVGIPRPAGLLIAGDEPQRYGARAQPVSRYGECLRRVAGWEAGFPSFRRDEAGGIAIDVFPRGGGAWILAFARMTKWRGPRPLDRCRGRAPALHITVSLQQYGGDPAGGFGEVLDLVRLEGPAEDGALAVGEPFLEDLVATEFVGPDGGGDDGVAGVASPLPRPGRFAHRPYRVVGGWLGTSPSVTLSYGASLAGSLQSGGQSSGGRRWDHGAISSNAAEARRTVASSNRLPTIWRPTGSPLSVNPHGMVAAGWPVRLNG